MVNFEAPAAVDKQEFKKPPSSTTVLIVGGGPSGLFTALLLAKNSIKSIVLERHSHRLGQPKAHAINPRSLEIFRQVGLDTAKIRSLGASADDAFWVRFVTLLTGFEIGALPYERQDEAVKELTPEPLLNISQPILEQYLQQAAIETGLVSIHRCWEWKENSFQADGKPVSRVVNRENTDEIVNIISDYVIAADGTDSQVRTKTPGIEWANLPGQPPSRREYVSIHVKGSIRQHMERLERPAQLYFCMHPKHSVGIICYDLDSSWVYSRPVNTTVEPIESFTEEKCRQLIDPLIQNVTYKVASVNIWATDPRIATSFADSTLRIFLVGDSAHSFPPQGGLGINTGIADVHNLCWKLSYIIHGRSFDAKKLLASYSPERKPVATANALQSFINESRWAAMRNVISDVLSWADLDNYDAIEEAFHRPDVAAKVKEQLEYNRVHFDSLALQLGYIYGEGDGTKLPENCSLFIPVACKGARLPHTWIGKGKSILDLLDFRNFTLFKYAEADLGEPVYEAGSTPVSIKVVAIDGISLTDEWKQLVGLKDRSVGLLVRPDGHILAHVKSAPDVKSALSSIF